MVWVRHMGKLLAITWWGTHLCEFHFILQQRISYRLRCCLKILAPDRISRHLTQFQLFLQLSLSYKPLWRSNIIYCATTLIRPLPFTFFFLLLIFFSMLTASILGLLLQTLPIMQSLRCLKWLPWIGFVIKPATICFVGHHLIVNSFIFTWSKVKK